MKIGRITYWRFGRESLEWTTKVVQPWLPDCLLFSRNRRQHCSYCVVQLHLSTFKTFENGLFSLFTQDMNNLWLSEISGARIEDVVPIANRAKENLMIMSSQISERQMGRQHFIKNKLMVFPSLDIKHIQRTPWKSFDTVVELVLSATCANAEEI